MAVAACPGWGVAPIAHLARTAAKCRSDQRQNRAQLRRRKEAVDVYADACRSVLDVRRRQLQEAVAPRLPTLRVRIHRRRYRQEKLRTRQ
jgi:hypothetical protein